MALSKVTAEERAKRSGARPVDVDFEKRYPSVWEYMTLDHYPDGQVRIRATMMVICEADVVKLCLNDRDNGQSMWVTGPTLAGALKALEGAVTCQLPPWRENRPYEPQQRRKR